VASQAHEHDRALRRAENVLDEVEHRRLRPVDVLDQDDERSDGCHGLEQPAHRPEGLLDGELRGGKADGCSDALRDRVVLRERSDLRPRDLRRILLENARRLANDLEDGPEGDAAPVRQAASSNDRGRAIDLCHELLGQAGLAHPRAAEDRGEPRTADRDGIGEGREQEPELPLPADERPVLARNPRRGLRLTEETVGRHWLGLAFELERLDRLDFDRVADEAICQVSEEHLARRGRLLEAGRDVDRVPGDEALAGGHVPGDDLTGVDAGPVREPHSPAALELFVQVREGGLHLGRPRSLRGGHRPHGASAARRPP
jgi:hypothetical protein